jgi:hypothetical protein
VDSSNPFDDPDFNGLPFDPSFFDPDFDSVHEEDEEVEHGYERIRSIRRPKRQPAAFYGIKLPNNIEEARQHFIDARIDYAKFYADLTGGEIAHLSPVQPNPTSSDKEPTTMLLAHYPPNQKKEAFVDEHGNALVHTTRQLGLAVNSLLPERMPFGAQYDFMGDLHDSCHPIYNESGKYKGKRFCWLRDVYKKWSPANREQWWHAKVRLLAIFFIWQKLLGRTEARCLPQGVNASWFWPLLTEDSLIVANTFSPQLRCDTNYTAIFPSESNGILKPEVGSKPKKPGSMGDIYTPHVSSCCVFSNGTNRRKMDDSLTFVHEHKFKCLPQRTITYFMNLMPNSHDYPAEIVAEMIRDRLRSMGGWTEGSPLEREFSDDDWARSNICLSDGSKICRIGKKIASQLSKPISELSTADLHDLFVKTCRDRGLKWWADMTDQEKQEHMKWWTDKTDQEKEEWQEYCLMLWADKTDQEKEEWREYRLKWWADKTDQEKQEHMKWWTDKTDQEKEEWREYRRTQEHADKSFKGIMKAALKCQDEVPLINGTKPSIKEVYAAWSSKGGKNRLGKPKTLADGTKSPLLMLKSVTPSSDTVPPRLSYTQIGLLAVLMNEGAIDVSTVHAARKWFANWFKLANASKQKYHIFDLGRDLRLLNKGLKT